MDKKLFKALILLISCAVLFVFLLWHIPIVFSFILKVFSVTRPIIIGFVIAFILNNPFLKLKILFGKLFKKQKQRKAVIALSILSVYILLGLFITAVILIIIPQVAQSISSFQSNIEDYYSKAQDFVNKNLDKINKELPSDINIRDKVTSYLNELPTILLGIFGVTKNVLDTLIDLFIGLVISIYILIGKDKLFIQLKKTLYAMFDENKAKKQIIFLTDAGKTFTNFISGQVTEACILGLLCFIGMSVFGFEYAFLISFIIALTSIMPIIGAFIGTIPSAILLLMISPIQALWFIIFIVILQQLESNLIYPRVVGVKVGLPALWVLVAVIVGGGAFGIIGMLIGVPTMSIIYETIKNKIKNRLNDKNVTIA